MGNRLVVAVAVVLLGGCKSSDGQTSADGGPPDTASDRQMLPEIILKGDGGDAADGRDAPPACTGPNCPVVLATDSDPTCCIAVDGTYVYWVSFASAWWIMRVAGGGGTPESIERSDSLIGDIAVQNGVLYWTASNGVFRRELTSAAATTTRLVSASANDGPIATDSNSVYWAGAAGGPIRKVPLAGGTSTDVVTGTDALYIASDGTNIYWSDFDMQGGAFVMAPVGGGTPTVLATALSNPGDIAIEGSNVYFANSSTLFGTKFWKVPLGGGTPVMLALSTAFNIRADIAVDATNVYWAGYRTIGKMPVGGGAITTVATAQAGAMYIAVDATNIYWVNTETDAGAIMKLPK